MKFRKNLASMAVSSIAGQLALVISGVVAARSLGPVDRGHLAILTLAPLLLAQTIQFGIPIAITYFIAADGGMSYATKQVTWKICIAQCAGVALLLALALIVGMPWIPAELYVPAILMIPAGALLIIQQYGFAVLQGTDKFSQVAIARLAPSAIYALISATLWILSSASLLTLSAAWVAANLISALTAIKLVKKSLHSRISIDRLRRPKELLSFGARAFVGSMSPIDTFKMDQLLGSLLLSPGALGIYVVAQSFSGLPKIVATNAGYVIYANAAQTQEKKEQRTLLNNVMWLSSFTLLFCIALYFSVPILNDIFFGESFADAAFASQILIAGAWIGAIRRYICEYAKGLGLPEISMWSELSICPILAILGWVLGGTWGVNGLAVALAISQALTLILSLFLARRKVNKVDDSLKKSNNLEKIRD